MATATLEIRNLPSTQVNELKRAADREGLSTEKYLKRMIESHLERIKRIESSSFFELAAPIRKTLKGKTEEELDGIVEAVRARRRSKKRRSD
jgi:hypothetical protein